MKHKIDLERWIGTVEFLCECVLKTIAIWDSWDCVMLIFICWNCAAEQINPHTLIQLPTSELAADPLKNSLKTFV